MRSMMMMMVMAATLAGCLPPALDDEPRGLVGSMGIAVEGQRVSAVLLPEASVAIVNGSGERADVSVRCTFFDDGGNAIANGRATVPGVPAGGSARHDVMSSTRVESFASVECSIADAWPA